VYVKGASKEMKFSYKNGIFNFQVNKYSRTLGKVEKLLDDNYGVIVSGDHNHKVCIIHHSFERNVVILTDSYE